MREPRAHARAHLVTRAPCSRQYRKSRVHFSHRFNVLHHLGAHSSLRATLSPEYPVCYEELRPPVVFEVEAYDSAACPRENFSPCPHPRDGHPPPTLPRMQLEAWFRARTPPPEPPHVI